MFFSSQIFVISFKAAFSVLFRHLPECLLWCLVLNCCHLTVVLDLKGLFGTARPSPCQGRSNVRRVSKVPFLPSPTYFRCVVTVDDKCFMPSFFLCILLLCLIKVFTLGQLKIFSLRKTARALALQKQTSGVLWILLKYNTIFFCSTANWSRGMLRHWN